MQRFDHRLLSLGAFVTLLALAPTVVSGQSLDSIPANARVRIDLPTAERSRFHRARVQSVVGTLETVRADTLLLVVRPGAVPLRVPREAVRAVYVSRGHQPRWRSALEGALLPALITAAFTAAGTSLHRNDGQPNAAHAALESAAWAGASGAVLGAWTPKERWRPIRISLSRASIVAEPPPRR